MTIFFDIMLVLCVVSIIVFSGYVLYRLVTGRIEPAIASRFDVWVQRGPIVLSIRTIAMGFRASLARKM